MTDLLPYALPASAGLLALLLAPAMDRWVERFDAWVGERLGVGQLAAEGFVIAGSIGVALEIIWFLGVGIGLWRGLPGEEARPETAGRQ